MNAMLLLGYGIAWRWKIVLEHFQFDPNEEPTEDFDELMRLAWYYVSNKVPTGDLLQSQYCIEDVAKAHQIYDDPQSHLFVSARILARQPMQEIALRSGVTRQVVEVYKLLFLDVDQLLDYPSEIATYVLEPRHDFDLTRYLVLKFCYQAGEASESMLECIPHLGQPHDLTTQEGRQREQLEILFMVERFVREQQLGDEAALELIRLSQEPRVNEPLTISELVGRQVSRTLCRQLPVDDATLPLRSAAAEVAEVRATVG